MVAQREDLRGLPLLLGNACEASKAQAKVMAETSAEVRRLRRDGASSREWLDGLGTRFADDPVGEARVRILEQMLQAETADDRCCLLQVLALNGSKAAQQAVARRAVFDVSRPVRETAIALLQKWYGSEAREVFLSALRHPWPLAADHAALALVALDDVEAVPALQSMLSQQDPSAPYEDSDGKWKRKELVRVNHLRNCLLCHPASLSARDAVSGPIPRPGEPLPEVYYQRDPESRAVRADVVYLRQDFSVTHYVKDAHPWPSDQRFDYLVQARELEPNNAKALAKAARAAKTYPQREAVRWALETLTGEATTLTRRR